MLDLLIGKLRCNPILYGRRYFREDLGLENTHVRLFDIDADVALTIGYIEALCNLNQLLFFLLFHDRLQVRIFVCCEGVELILDRLLG